MSDAIEICVIEDDPVERTLLARRIAQLGYVVLEAATGDEAWALIQKHRPRVVLCDIMLPGINGIEICRRMRADGALEGAYFMAITALGEREIRREALDAGADDFLHKPYDPEELAAQVRNGVRIQRLQERLRRAATTDGLTDVANYTSFCEALDREFSRTTRYGGCLSLIMADLDHFKAVNDTLGHEVGNEVLRAAARHLCASVRGPDLVARYGGEEFAIILPETPLDDAAMLAQRIRVTLPKQVRIPASQQFTIRASLGVASTNDPRARTVYELIKLADAAMYQSKRHGRDRVTRCDEIGDDGLPAASPSVHEMDHLRKELHRLDLHSKELTLQTMWALVQALEARDPYTAWHSRNVTLYTRWMLEGVEWPTPRRVATINAAMLHDLGKIGVPDEILHKPTPLEASELATVRQVPTTTCRILEPLRVFAAEIEIIRFLREHFDGSGYPQGLRGDAIPLGSRLLAVAEAYDAMTCDRSYRASRSIPTVLAELRSESGRHFDPQFVRMLESSIQRNRARWEAQIEKSREQSPSVAELVAV
ncbi:MAG: diguanylate cyclase [Phycisphaerae bacterium]